MVTWLDSAVGYLPLKDIPIGNDEGIKEEKHFGASIAYAYTAKFSGLPKNERE